MNMLEIKNLHVAVDGKEILRGVNLTIKEGELHALMGTNGSGKSTLAMTLMGHPRYTITQGEILVDGKNINGLKPHERAKLGFFLSMQHPLEIEGVRLGNFLYQGAKSLERVYGKDVLQFRKELKEKAGILGMPESIADRGVNLGFSGGEKKKSEILQMQMLKPRFAIIDEVDSGLDIDSLKMIAKEIERMKDGMFSGLLVTHYQRILNHVHPEYVHVMMDGKIVNSGGGEIVKEIEERGYGSFKT